MRAYIGAKSFRAKILGENTLGAKTMWAKKIMLKRHWGLIVTNKKMCFFLLAVGKGLIGS